MTDRQRAVVIKSAEGIAMTLGYLLAAFFCGGGSRSILATQYRRGCIANKDGTTLGMAMRKPLFPKIVESQGKPCEVCKKETSALYRTIANQLVCLSCWEKAWL